VTPAEQVEQIRQMHKECIRMSFSSDSADRDKCREIFPQLAISGVAVLLVRLEYLEARVKELEAKQ